MDNELLKDTVLKLKDRIIKTEAGNIQLSETDTRQGLINPLFRALQWDFGDFESIKSELRVPKFNEPVDYAFYSSKKKTDTPILLLEAKRLGSDQRRREPPEPDTPREAERDTLARGYDGAPLGRCRCAGSGQRIPAGAGV